MQYIKHYYVDAESPSSFCCTATEPRYKRHPIEYSGLDVKVWLSDSNGVDVMLAQLPDDTTVADVTHDGYTCVKVLTETQFNSVWTPYSEAGVLYAEATVAERDGDDATAATKRTSGDAKIAEATTAIHALE
jgi:hypothetical protein